MSQYGEIIKTALANAPKCIVEEVERIRADTTLTPQQRYQRSARLLDVRYQQRHRDLENAKAKERYKKNPGEYARRRAVWRKGFFEQTGVDYGTEYHRRKRDEKDAKYYTTRMNSQALQRGAVGILSVETVEKCLTSPCHFCGDESTSIDHITPLAKGGTNTDDNVRGTCVVCNMLRNTLSDEEFVEHCAKVALYALEED